MKIFAVFSFDVPIWNAPAAMAGKILERTESWLGKTEHGAEWRICSSLA